MKMNALLAKDEHAKSPAKAMIKDYGLFFKTKQGAFRGEKNTYSAVNGYDERPERNTQTTVQTTVKEKLTWFEERFIPYLKDSFSIDATNAGEDAYRVELVVDGVSFGKLTALDLMKLRNLLQSPDLNHMYENIPVRSDAKIYEECTDSQYDGREIFQTPILKSDERTTEKEEVILKDPNLGGDFKPNNYTPKTTIKSKTVKVAETTHQEFTGEWTQRKRAELLRRRSNLLNAVIVALKEVNDIEAKKPNLDVDALMSYIHYGEVKKI
jgi:hypothetical protein